MQEVSINDGRPQAPMRKETVVRGRAVLQAPGEEPRVWGREILESYQGKAVGMRMTQNLGAAEEDVGN